MIRLYTAKISHLKVSDIRHFQIELYVAHNISVIECDSMWTHNMQPPCGSLTVTQKSRNGTARENHITHYHMVLPCGAVTGFNMKYGHFPVRVQQGGPYD